MQRDAMRNGGPRAVKRKQAREKRKLAIAKAGVGEGGGGAVANCTNKKTAREVASEAAATRAHAGSDGARS